MTAMANAHWIQKAYEVLIDPAALKQYERDTFRKRTARPYLLPGQRPPTSFLGKVAFTVFVVTPIIVASYYLAVFLWRYMLHAMTEVDVI